MAVIKENPHYAIKIEYKPSFDLSGNLNLPAYSQTFTKINELATEAQLLAFADALMNLTVYREAPYRVSFINTAQLIDDFT